MDLPFIDARLVGTHLASIAVSFLLALPVGGERERSERSAGPRTSPLVAVARGVSYCAICDGPFFQDQTIAVVDRGNTAVEEATYLPRFATKVSIVHRGGPFSASA